MKIFAIILVLFGLVIIYNPDIIAYLIGGLFVFLGLNMLIMSILFSRKKKESFVKFGTYKIFR